jgi:thiamine kinase-like enzyme
MSDLVESPDRAVVDEAIPESTRRVINAAVEAMDVAAFLPGPVVTRLDGGASNQNFLVRSAAGKAVLRIASDLALANRFALDRWRGFLAHQAAADIGVAPRVLAVALPTGHSVVEYVDGSLVDDISILADSVLEQCVLALRAVHVNAEVKCGEFNGLAEIDRFIDICRREGIALPGDIGKLHGIARDIEQVFRAVGVPSVLCHNDVQLENLVRSPDGDRVWVLDWEYGGKGNPYFDLAMLVNNAGLDQANTSRVLLTYFDTDRACDHARVRLNRFQSAMREALWSLVAKPVLAHTGWDYDAWAERFFMSARQMQSLIVENDDLNLAGPSADDDKTFGRVFR